MECPFHVDFILPCAVQPTGIGVVSKMRMTPSYSSSTKITLILACCVGFKLIIKKNMKGKRLHVIDGSDLSKAVVKVVVRGQNIFAELIKGWAWNE